MSYDILLEGAKEYFHWDPTYNFGPMFEAAFGEPIRQWNGQTARDVYPKVERGYLEMIRTPEEYEALDAPNGWGTYDELMNRIPYLSS